MLSSALKAARLRSLSSTALVALIVVVAAASLGACSGSDDSPTPTPASPASSGPATGASAPTPTPPSAGQPTATVAAPQPTLGPVDIADVTAPHLAAMVLTQDAIEPEVPGLAFSSQSGEIASDTVASHTVDPTDTGDVVLSLGYVGGYQNTFSNPSVPFSVNVSSRVYLWKDENAAGTS